MPIQITGGIATDRRSPTTASHPCASADGAGMRPLVAHCHLGLSKRYSRIGEAREAQEHLTTATTMYRRGGMTYWLERTTTELNS
jgi:hypothetical protein